jgi:antitoxin MazE
MRARQRRIRIPADDDVDGRVHQRVYIGYPGRDIMMVSKVQQWGNSQGLRLPKTVLNLAHIEVGDEVEIIVDDNQILVKKVTPAKFDLPELVSRIPKGHKSKEVNFGPPVGKEDW